MIVVKIEIYPSNQKPPKEIGRISIANDLTGNEEKGNYEIMLRKKEVYENKTVVKEPWLFGKLKNYDRSLSVYHLLFETLKTILNKG